MRRNADLSKSIEGAVLAGVDVLRIASALGVTPKAVAEWRNGAAVPEEHRKPLCDFAVRLVLNEIARVGQAAVEQPKLIHTEPFRDYLNDLNLAHWLVFGQSFLRYLREWDRDHGEAKHDERA